MTETSSPYIVPKEPGRWRAITLAGLVHAALLVMLWIGVQWQNETPATIEAEVWSPQVREAAPVPQPPKVVEPKPQPVVKDAPEPKVTQPPVPKPDIALEQEKKRKAEEKKRQEEQERLAKEKKRLEEERLAKEKKRLEEERLEKARIAKEKADKEKKAAEEKRKQEELELAKAREEEMRRITGGVTGTGGSGDAAKSQGGRASAEYGSKIAARIKSHTVFNVPEGVAGNPPVEYAVDLLPDGSLRGPPRKLKSSGVPGFDDAVLRAIDRSQPFPRDDRTGQVPSSVIVSHKPKDQ